MRGPLGHQDLILGLLGGSFCALTPTGAPLGTQRIIVNRVVFSDLLQTTVMVGFFFDLFSQDSMIGGGG